jgi:UDP-N-acetylmuramate-alanine ligase
VSSFLIADELSSAGRMDHVVCGDFGEASELVRDEVRAGDLVLTIGAGSIECLGGQILANMRDGPRGRKPLENAATAL